MLVQTSFDSNIPGGGKKDNNTYTHDTSMVNKVSSTADLRTLS
jgi:hypothetical protein